MKPLFAQVTCLVIFSFLALNATAQNFFRDAPETAFRFAGQKRVIIPARYRTLQLDNTMLTSYFKTIPSENIIPNKSTAPIIELPMPDGSVSRFRIWESPVMDPALAAKYQEIKTFTGQGIDDPTANVKLDWTQFGFHAMIISPVNGTVFLDPYAQGNTASYISYHKKDFIKAGKYVEQPVLKFPGIQSRPVNIGNVLAGVCIGSQLRTYRLALAANGEYTAFHGGTKAGALAAEVTTMNRVNGVYERELSIRMVIVANNDLIIYTNGGTDPYTNDNPGAVMLTENQGNLDAVIGDANYDIGHVFSTGGGGVAQLGVVCVTGNKAQGVTGTTSPIGDPYDIDYVAHEMGHQFGANHPFNSATGGCSDNGSTTTNAEPGSGSTIMAYAGLCSGDNLQTHSDAQFHAVSFSEITDNIVGGNANTCAGVTATGNTPPVVNAGSNYIIPKSTPFVLTGSGTDANGDVLSYSWEQIDVGGPFGSWDNPLGNAPIFRSFIPQSTPIRYFPSVINVVNNSTSTGELMPSYARTMHFRLTGRDNRAGGGGVCFSETAITVNGTSGPFLVISPNAATTWLVNEFRTITWDVAGTASAPINCSNVKIELSTNGGLTYTVVLAASTPNDGTEEIQVPNSITTKARIRISAVGNVFYDISNANFSIQNSPASEFVFNNPQAITFCGAGNAVTNLKTGALNGFGTAINLSATGNPAGSTVSFGTNPLAPGSTTTVTLVNNGSMSAGIYNITINGSAGAVNKSRIISFVYGTPASSSLILPANNAIGVNTLPLFKWNVVAAATSYTLDISTSNTFAAFTQSISGITASTFTLVTPLAENTVYYWRVRSVNSCGSATSGSGIFKTGIPTCKNSTDLPKTISASGSPTVSSTLTIPANAGVPITDINVVGLKGTHNYINDLTIELTSPNGTTVTLFDQICADQHDFDLNLDDEAASADFPCPPVAGVTVRPQDSLALFKNQNSAGTWTLTVRDNFNGDGGSLTGWGLYINNCLIKATPISSVPPWTQLCAPTASTSLVSSLTGTTYQWQVNTGSGFANITNNANYAGVNTATLQISNAPSSWNGYQYRAIVDGANSTVLILGFTNYWNGTVSNAWENPANWSCNSIPDINTDVFINTGTVVINSNGVCRSIKVSPGASVTVNTSFNLKVAH